MSFLDVSVFIIIVLCLFTVIKAIYGPTLWDRLLCMSILSSKTIVVICLIAIISEKRFLLDVAMVFSILGFIGIVYLSRYLQGREKDE